MYKGDPVLQIPLGTLNFPGWPWVPYPSRSMEALPPSHTLHGVYSNTYYKPVATTSPKTRLQEGCLFFFFFPFIAKGKGTRCPQITSDKISL